jgi:hypothetical protein
MQYFRRKFRHIFPIIHPKIPGIYQIHEICSKGGEGDESIPQRILPKMILERKEACRLYRNSPPTD